MLENHPIIDFLDKKSESVIRIMKQKKKERSQKELSSIQWNLLLHESMFEEMIIKPLTNLKNEINASFQKKKTNKTKFI